jgi:ribulose-5-phosphate 4-epimerase/fuculose-1-phosphate aldolase
MPPVLHATEKFGDIIQVPDKPAHSQELADVVADGLRPQISRLARGAVAVMAPKHGLVTLAKDLAIAFDSVERIDTNAYCILHAGAIGGL